MTAATPADVQPRPSLRSPIPSAMAQARYWAAEAEQNSEADAFDLAVMWAAVAQAEELGRLRRDLRAGSDSLLRLLRHLSEGADR